MVFRITGGITIDGGLSSSGREPDPPTNVTATKVNETTARITVTDPVNQGGLPITTYTASTYIVTQLGGTGEATYSTPGTYIWTAPAGVTSVCVVCIGGGGGGGVGGIPYNGYNSGGGGGGGLAYLNNYPVTSGSTYTVVVGAGGTRGLAPNAGQPDSNPPTVGGDSYFVSRSVCMGGGGNIRTGGYDGGLGGTYTVTTSTGSYGGGNGGKAETALVEVLVVAVVLAATKVQVVTAVHQTMEMAPMVLQAAVAVVPATDIILLNQKLAGPEVVEELVY